jgi:hypothetical protein
MEKKAITLGDLLAIDAARLLRRRRPSLPWLKLLEPVIARQVTRSEGTERFKRVDPETQAPRQTTDEPLPGAGEEEEAPFEGGEPLDPLVRDRLRDHVGPAVDSAMIHRDRQADVIARGSAAEAVTVGRDIFFRPGAYEPQSPKGLGLIGHEMLHVSESDERSAAPSWSRSQRLSAEERTAQRIEQSIAAQTESPVLGRPAPQPLWPAPVLSAVPATGPQPIRPAPVLPDATAPAPQPIRPALVPSPAAAPAPGPAPVLSAAPAPAPPPIRPAPVLSRAAAPVPTAMRAMKAEVDRPAADTTPAPPSVLQFESMRRALFRDLMAQLKVEFERGA